MKGKDNSYILFIAILLLFLLAGLGIGLVAGKAAANRKSNELNGDGWYIYSNKYNHVYVELDCNPTTGFDWVVGEVPEGLELDSRKYVSSDRSGTRMGAGGTTTLCFKAKAEGLYMVELVYKRNWEGGETARILELHIDVAKSSKGRYKINGLTINDLLQ